MCKSDLQRTDDYIISGGWNDDWRRICVGSGSHKRRITKNSTPCLYRAGSEISRNDGMKLRFTGSCGCQIAPSTTEQLLFLLTIMDKLPAYRHGTARPTMFRYLAAVVLVAIVTATSSGITLGWHHQTTVNVPINAAQIVDKCRALDVLPGPPNNFHERTQSDRYEAGTPPTLIKNATIWTGNVDGHEVVVGDILLDKGIILEVGNIEESLLNSYKSLVTVNAGGAWVTPGYISFSEFILSILTCLCSRIVDMHSHLGVDSAPALRGSDDTNSLKGLVLPWLRSLDGLNTHDDAYRLSISGGVTTANVLPGSADAIGIYI